MQRGVGRVRDGGEGGVGSPLTCPLAARGQDSKADFGDICVVVMLLLALTAMAESNDAKDACGADDVMCVAPGPLIGCLHGRGALCILPAAADAAIRLADAVVVSRPSCNDAPEASADGAADGESRAPCCCNKATAKDHCPPLLALAAAAGSASPGGTVSDDKPYKAGCFKGAMKEGLENDTTVLRDSQLSLASEAPFSDASMLISCPASQAYTKTLREAWTTAV
ncbi:MAG: hypothetical protein FRX49_10562 [Trebouxia sp. A1-2]|nr:MAG: hypothetical protein FRX49_10562 [Trebouxia sp. A1-2]